MLSFPIKKKLDAIGMSGTSRGSQHSRSLRAGRSIAARQALDGDHSDVVFLPKLSGCLHNRGGGLGGYCLSPLKSEQFALRVLSLDHAIGIKRQPAHLRQMEMCDLIGCIFDNAERQSPG